MINNNKTETEIRFDAYLKQGYYLINKQKMDIEFANQLMAICENLKIRYQEIKDSRDNWRKKYEELKKSEGEE